MQPGAFTPSGHHRLVILPLHHTLLRRRADLAPATAASRRFPGAASLLPPAISAMRADPWHRRQAASPC
jgi:hypothetical protein